jgi:hypothetical protein
MRKESSLTFASDESSSESLTPSPECTFIAYNCTSSAYTCQPAICPFRARHSCSRSEITKVRKAYGTGSKMKSLIMRS